MIFLFILLQGKIYRFGDVMAAHRVELKKEGTSWNLRKRRRNYLIEECSLKQRLMQWCEENVGLTESALPRADRELKTALSVLLKHPGRQSAAMFFPVLRYWLHLRCGKPRLRDDRNPAVQP